MSPDPSKKYRPSEQVPLADRQWPSRTIQKPPVWCSVDLRDGNQALIEPMDAARKTRMFLKLVEIGFKEIEIGFPSASQTEFDFCRQLIEGNLIPDDVTVQVLVQAREPLIERTFEALRGIRRAIVHLYNSTSTLQRRVVFGLDQAGIKEIAVNGAKSVIKCAARYPETEWVFQYSPESFTGTELDYAVEICEAVMDVWEASPQRKAIINLPATVEMSTPNIYADQIEWFCRNTSKRDSMIVSVHPHNDRGTGVAAAELGLLAGGDRVEGTLFGNGERTGNVDIVTLALNMYSQGLQPGLDFSHINDVMECAEFCTQLPIHPRHPYAGDLVFTAFSGSHQDAIKKGFAAQEKRNDEIWAVPYLPIDPADLGRTYEAVIRVNSQSGKGGFAWVIEQDQGLKLPKRMQAHFSRHVQQLADEVGRELQADDIWNVFQRVYRLNEPQRFQLVEYEETRAPDRSRIFAGKIRVDGKEQSVSGRGNGLISAILAALDEGFGVRLEVRDYTEHAMATGSDAKAAAYVECVTPDGGTVWGVGIHNDVATAGVRAVLSAANALSAQGK